MTHEGKYKLVNALCFQGVWFTCIFGSDISAISVTILFLILHFNFSPKPFETQLILAVGVAGFILDCLIAGFGFIEFKSKWDFPVFLLCIWIAFAATLKHSSSVFFTNTFVAAIIGLLAPLSYFAAQNMGKVVYSEPLYSSIILHALLWCVLMVIIKFSFFKKEISVNA